MTTAVSDLRSAVQAAVTQVVEAESLHLETLVAEAVRLQDYDRLDHLVIVDQVGHPRTVASMLDL